MILLWNSADMDVELTFAGEDGSQDTVTWEAGRTLAKNMLQFIAGELEKRGLGVDGVTGMGVFRGPGSFTGLRIGLSVLNTWANAQNIPIVGETGDDWREACLRRLNDGDDDKIVMPEYGSEAHVTKQRK